MARHLRGVQLAEATIARLPRYQRIVSEAIEEGITTISSEELAQRAQVTAATVRKDLLHFGNLGVRGAGYELLRLLAVFKEALGANKQWSVAIVGAGNLGRALANSEGFQGHGFYIAALYDANPAIVGRRVGGLRVQPMEQLVRVKGERAASVGVIATPKDAAQRVADILVRAGVQTILNFAPCELMVPNSVVVRHVDLLRELQVLGFHLTQGDGEGSSDAL